MSESSPFFGFDRSVDVVSLADHKPMTRDEYMAALEEGARLLALPPRPPCGADAKHPHIVAPGGKSGDLRRCVQCGTYGTLP